MNPNNNALENFISQNQWQISEDALWMLGIGTLLVLFILDRIGAARFNGLKSTYVDNFSDQVKKVLANSSNIQSNHWPDFQKNKAGGLNELEKLQKNIDNNLKNIETIKPLAWNEFKLTCNKSRLEEVALYDAKYESLTQHLAALKAEYEKLNSSDLTVKHNHYYTFSSEYKSLCDLTNQWTTALNLYNQVLSEIDEAQSAISSAETAEMVDLFSKNKGVSIWSSMENSSAQSEIEDIKPSIERLVNHLKTLESQQSVVVQKIEVSDTVDLVADLFFDFSFDFTSVFSLMSLGSASDSVDKVERQIKELGEPIKNAVNQHEKVQKEFLRKLT